MAHVQHLSTFLGRRLLAKKEPLLLSQLAVTFYALAQPCEIILASIAMFLAVPLYSLTQLVTDNGNT
jgi:hypothetical protein